MCLFHFQIGPFCKYIYNPSRNHSSQRLTATEPGECTQRWVSMSCCSYCDFHPGKMSGPITRDLLFFLSPFLRIRSLIGAHCSGVLEAGLFMGGLFGTSRPSIGQSNAFKNKWKNIRTIKYESFVPLILHSFSKN